MIGYSAEPLPSYPGLRNCSYSITLSYVEYPSTNQVHWPRPGTTISPSGSSLASATPRHRVYRWISRQKFPLWLPVASWCTIQWDEVLRSTFSPPPEGIPTPRPPHVLPSSVWSPLLPGDGILTINLASPPSPPIFHFHTGVMTAPPPCTSSSGPATLLPYFPEPLQSPPTASTPYTGSGTPPPNRCYYMRFSARVTGSPPTVVGPPHWYGTCTMVTGEATQVNTSI